MSGSEGRELSWRGRIERARFRSRRGLLELELLLAPFASERLPHIGTRALADYEQLLEFDDLTLHAWLLAREPVPREQQPIVGEIRRHLKLE